MSHPDPKRIKAARQKRQYELSRLKAKPPLCTNKRGNMNVPEANTQLALIVQRAQSTIRSRKVKPSMPKMPWDTTP